MRHIPTGREYDLMASRLGVMLGVYVGGKSGAHLNPAVTFADWQSFFENSPGASFRDTCWLRRVGPCSRHSWSMATTSPPSISSREVRGIRTVPGYSNHSTAGIFCTYPAPFMSTTGQFFSEFIASAILMFCIYALRDDDNLGSGNLTPLGLFFVIFGIEGACFGWETGYAINFARDFGPRLVSYMLGYGHEVWSAGNYYFWVRPKGVSEDAH